jgi:hypothetical protein
MPLSTLNKEFLSAMVQSMYQYETMLVKHADLLTDAEMLELYKSYMYYAI